MKCIKIIPKPTRIGLDKYEITVGRWRKGFQSHRTAKQEAEQISKDLTTILIDVNLLFEAYLAHSRKCWLLEAPHSRGMIEDYQVINYHMTQATANHSNARPIAQMESCISVMDRWFAETMRFYKLRNHHALVTELRSLQERSGILSGKLSDFNLNNDTVLFSKRV